MTEVASLRPADGGWHPVIPQAACAELIKHRKKIAPLLGRADLGDGLFVDVDLSSPFSNAIFFAKVELRGNPISVSFSRFALDVLLAPYTSSCAFLALPPALQRATLQAAWADALALHEFPAALDSAVQGLISPAIDLDSSTPSTEPSAISLTLYFKKQGKIAWVCVFPTCDSHYELLEGFLRLKSPTNRWGNILVRCSLRVGHSVLPWEQVRQLSSGDVFFFSTTRFREAEPVFTISIGNCIFTVEQTSARSLTVSEIEQREGQVASVTTLDPSVVTVNVSVEAGAVMLPVSQLIEITEGFVLDLRSNLEDPLIVKVNDATVGTCRLVEMDGRLGAQFLSVIDSQPMQDSVSRFVSPSEDTSETPPLPISDGSQAQSVATPSIAESQLNEVLEVGELRNKENDTKASEYE